MLGSGAKGGEQNVSPRSMFTPVLRTNKVSGVSSILQARTLVPPGFSDFNNSGWAGPGIHAAKFVLENKNINQKVSIAHTLAKLCIWVIDAGVL